MLDVCMLPTNEHMRMSDWCQLYRRNWPQWTEFPKWKWAKSADTSGERAEQTIEAEIKGERKFMLEEEKNIKKKQRKKNKLN